MQYMVSIPCKCWQPIDDLAWMVVGSIVGSCGKGLPNDEHAQGVTAGSRSPNEAHISEQR